MNDFVTKVLSTIITVVIAVGVSGALWVLANLVVNRLRDSSTRATIIGRATTGFAVAGLLSGNRLTKYSTTTDSNFVASFTRWAWLPVATALVIVLLTSLAERQTVPRLRFVTYIATTGLLGGALAWWLNNSAIPKINLSTLVSATVVGATICGLLATTAHRSFRRAIVLRGGLLGASFGMVLGAWGFGDLGSGSRFATVLLGLIMGAIIGVRWAVAPRTSPSRLPAMEVRARAAVFLGPALGFIAIALVIPSLRTIYLSFLDRKSNYFVGIDNYVAIFRNSKSWDMSRIGSLWSSQLTIAAAVCLVFFIITALRTRRRTGHWVEFGSPSAPPLALAVVFGGFALFSTLRGTLVNNLWWVFVVTIFSTSIGLLIAVLADGVKFERTAKAIIFMPLAVSLVGASVIWRLVYISRDSSKPQSGTLNAMWVGLGRLSTGEGTAQVVIGGLVLVPTLVALLVVVQHLVRREWSRVALPSVVFGLGTWFSLRYWQVLGTGLGGHRLNKAGETVGDPINFLQEAPFNNFWLMVVLIWIETGFAMVIFSAAIRAVPRELTDAARVDGADTQQIFWKITLPHIGPTIGVVATTIMILVMKVFDIAKVMTNGNFGTEVLANNMYREAFYNLNIGLGAALAVIIFVSVLPIMYVNIRRMTKTA